MRDVTREDYVIYIIRFLPDDLLQRLKCCGVLSGKGYMNPVAQPCSRSRGRPPHVSVLR